MKVKIKGLVFVGFAAAVFAQSAFAAITPNATTDPKTVTSKKYVDEKIPGTYAMTYGGTTHEAETTAGAVVLGNGYGEVKFTKLSNSSADVHTTNGQDVVVTGKAVADAMAVTQNLQAEDYTQITDIHATANDPTSAVIGHKVVLDSTKIDFDGTDIQAAGSTNDDNLVTAGAVKASMATSITSSSTNTMLATPKAVYDYAQPMVADDNGAGVYLGKWNETGGVGEWSQLTTNGYVTADTTSGYAIELDGAKITSNNNNGADITAAGETIGTGDTITDAEKEKLTTAKAVYDFVTGYVGDAAYQPEVAATSAEANKVLIGYRSYDSTAAAGSQYGNPGWQVLGGDNTYITVSSNGSAATVALGNIAADADVYGSSTSNDTKLATAGSVRKLLDTSLSNVANAENDQTVPTSKAVVDYVAGFGIGATLPTECSGASSTHVCALVAYYDTTTSAVKYEWTIMAPTGN